MANAGRLRSWGRSGAFYFGILAISIAALSAGAANAVILDFTGFQDGEDLEGVMFAPGVTVTSSGGVGAAVFDTAEATTPGNCTTGPDTDLCVAGQGNVLIVQQAGAGAKTGNVYDTPDDDVGFVINLMWQMPVTLESVTLIDWNGGTGGSFLTITDAMDNTATWTFPSQDWTGELGIGGSDGKGLFDLTNFAAQSDDGGPPSAAAVFGGPGTFDGTKAVKLTVSNPSSGAIDDIVFTPEPSTALLLAGGLLGLLRAGRRRR
jgi:hypothetical protein